MTAKKRTKKRKSKRSAMAFKGPAFYIDNGQKTADFSTREEAVKEAMKWWDADGGDEISVYGTLPFRRLGYIDEYGDFITK